MPIFLRKLLFAALLLFASGAFAFWFVLEQTTLVPADLSSHFRSVWQGGPWDGGRTESELLRYAQRRVSGHPALESVISPLLKARQRQVERPTPELTLPTLGKGQNSLPAGESPAPGGRLPVSTVDALRQAFAAALPGQTIELQPGHYLINERLLTGRAGRPGLPVIVRAAQPGQVFIDVNAEEGFKLTQADWVFENLNISGVCSQDDYCEHAFHVVGKARRTIIRNNRIENFNAHIKVNGEGGEWPDDGRLEFNTLSNSRPRRTDRPVTPVDLVGASRWTVADNVVSNFVKADGDAISYGIYMKGAGSEGRIEKNLVICTSSDISQAGIRVGISFGGGGSGAQFCRDGACRNEHSGGIASNNIIAHCNDFGLDVLNGSHIVLAHNTLINTSGISARGEGTSVLVYGNLYEGRIVARNGAQTKTLMNDEAPADSFMNAPDRLDLVWRKRPEKIPSLPAVGKDFCAHSRADATLPGALGDDVCPTSG